MSWIAAEDMGLTRRDRGMLAVAIVLDVAFYSASDTVVSGADLAERTGMVRRTLEPLLQALSRDRILDSTRGPHGGYRLGRSARLLKITDVIAVGLATLEDGGVELSGRLQKAVVEPLWAEFDEAIMAIGGNLTIEDLLKRAAKAGLRKPIREPLNFVI